MSRTHCGYAAAYVWYGCIVYAVCNAEELQILQTYLPVFFVKFKQKIVFSEISAL